MSSNRLLNLTEMNRLLTLREEKDGEGELAKIDTAYTPRKEVNFIAEHFKKLEIELNVDPEKPSTAADPKVLEALPTVWQFIPENMHEEFRDILGMRYVAYVALEQDDSSLFEEYTRRKYSFLQKLNEQSPQLSSSSSGS